jgi:hypothetical protein
VIISVSAGLRDRVHFYMIAGIKYRPLAARKISIQDSHERFNNR